MKGRAVFTRLAPAALAALFLVIFLRDTVPAWREAREMQQERDRLANESREIREEIERYRTEKEHLEKSYFYNERIRRLLYQSGPEETKKK